ncbi:ComF family protein [Sphingobacterium sp. MYb388]|uniref:ComF family protein n=1 Tax=Sphingobacterium sp. MYb388 TaxID=2745437 RepID=UPI0030A1962C
MRNPNEWLELDGRKAPVHYVCGYLPRSQGYDPISESILSLKKNYRPAVNVWLGFMYDDFGKLEHDLKDIMVRALGHNEQRATFASEKEQPLAYLCHRTARASRIRYPFDMIKKLHETPELKYLSKEDRWDALKDTFQVCYGYNRRTFRRFWFIDDVITTGATARAVWKALLKDYPDIDFRVYALARTVYDPTFNKELEEDKAYQEMRDFYYPTVREEGQPYLSNFNGVLKLPMPSFNNEGTFFI